MERGRGRGGQGVWDRVRGRGPQRGRLGGVRREERGERHDLRDRRQVPAGQVKL